MRPITLGIAAVLVLFAVITGFNSFSTVNPGEKGVLVSFGQVQNEVEPGVFTKIPFFTDIERISTRDQVANFQNLEAYTRDQQVATVTNVSVTYRVDPARVTEIYTRFGSSERMVEQLLTRPIGALLEQTFGGYNAETAVRERVKLGAEFAERIKSAVADQPLVITTVNIENVSFPAEYEANINARMAAEVNALRAEQDAKKTLIDAQAQADAELALATAQAQAVTLRGEAEANAIRAKGDALRENPSLVSLTKAEKWNGVLPTTVLPGDTVPFLDVATLGAAQ